MVTTNNVHAPELEDDWFGDADEIALCLSCDKPECNNCLGDCPAKYKGNYNFSNVRKVDAEEFVRLYNEGELLARMAIKLGLQYSDSLYRWARMMKIPLLPTSRPALTLEQIEKMPRQIRVHFTLKGVPMA